MADIPRMLLQHVLDNDCQDPDCEIHNIEVAVAEGVILPASAAYWLAGWYACLDHVTNAMDEVRDEAMREGAVRIGHTP